MSNSLKIDVIVNDGSPLGVVHKDIYGQNGRLGIGGAELALLTMCEAWSNVGHIVRLFNNPHPLTKHGSPFQQFSLDAFSPHDYRDVLIVFRSPNKRIKDARGKVIWWSTDQYTVGSFKDFARQVDEIVTISPHHAEHFRNVYQIDGTHVIDLPVRISDYESAPEKIKDRLIFCSVPDRGLHILADVFPSIKEAVPNASLVITSDYRLWGADGARNERFIQKFLGIPDIKFLGAIPRKEMVIEQQLAELQPYPCIYEELFCYAVAECQVAGALPITSDMGALATTNMGVLLSGNPDDRLWRQAFVDVIVQHLKLPNLGELQTRNQAMALERFSLKRILGEWDTILNG